MKERGVRGKVQGDAYTCGLNALRNGVFAVEWSLYGIFIHE